MCDTASSLVRALVLFTISVALLIIVITLNAVTLTTINKRFDELRTENDQTTTHSTISSTGKSTTSSSTGTNFVDTIHIEDVMGHLRDLQRIAEGASNTRAVGTRGFTETVDYIYNYLRANASNLEVFRQPFLVRNFTIRGSPILILSTNGVNRTFTYSTNLARADFTYTNYSVPINLTEFSYVVIPNFGCDEVDWENVSGRAGLVIAGGPCTTAEKSEIANRNNASAILYYNNGLTTSSIAPLSVRLRQANKIPGLFLSYAAGQELIKAVNTSTASIWIQIEIENYPSFSVENICAHTNEGNANETILIGGHCDSVPVGPGINDNG